ncbi:MAG: hypothetical protein KDA96_21305 [Planctomycetaceae bacterium]|nr:hypothetical protein [Planctomycetaceae bacterium]
MISLKKIVMSFILAGMITNTASALDRNGFSLRRSSQKSNVSMGSRSSSGKVSSGMSNSRVGHSLGGKSIGHSMGSNVSRGKTPVMTGKPTGSVLNGKGTHLPGRTTSLPGKFPTMPGKTPTMPGKVPTFPGKVPTMPGKNPTFPGKVPTLPGKNPTFPGKVPTLPGRNPTFPGKVPTLPGKNPTFPGKVPTLPGIPTLPGKPNFPGKPPVPPTGPIFPVPPTTPIPPTCPPTYPPTNPPCPPHNGNHGCWHPGVNVWINDFFSTGYCATPCPVPGFCVTPVVETVIVDGGIAPVAPVDIQVIPRVENGASVAILLNTNGMPMGRAALVVNDQPIMIEITDWQAGAVTVQLPSLLLTAEVPAAIFIADAEGNVMQAQQVIILPTVSQASAN